MGGREGGDEQLEDKMSRCGNERGRIIKQRERERERESDVTAFGRSDDADAPGIQI